MDKKPKPRPKPKPKPKPKPAPGDIKTQITDLKLVVIHRITCGVCQSVLAEMDSLGVTNAVKLVNIDTEDWGSYLNVPGFPEGSLSLPIIISQKTKKFSLGYITVSDLIKKLA